VQRTLGYNPGGDLALDIHAGGVTYGYGYNAAKRLVAVNQNGSSAGAYAYDFNGQRVWRQTFAGGAAQVAYVYDEAGHLLAEQNASTGAAMREYVWIDDMPVALLDISGSTAPRDRRGQALLIGAQLQAIPRPGRRRRGSRALWFPGDRPGRRRRGFSGSWRFRTPKRRGPGGGDADRGRRGGVGRA
jgi:YD repeat-containing protein